MMKLWSALGAPGRLQFVLAMGLAAVAAIAGVVLMGLSGWFLVAGALAGVAGAGHSFNHLFPSAGVRGAAFTRVLGRYGEQLAGHDATLSLSARLRPRVFEAGARSRRGLSPMASADLTALVDDMDAAEGAFLKVVLPGIGVISGYVIALGLALASDVVLFVLAVLAAALAAGALPFLAVQAAQRRAAVLSLQADAARGDVARLIENATELDVYGALRRYAGEAEATLARWQKESEALERPFRGLSAILSAVGVGMGVLALWRAAVTQGDLPMAAGAALALMAAFEAASAMLKVMEAAPKAKAASDRLADRLEGGAAAWDAAPETAQAIDSVFPLEVRGLTVSAAPGAPQTPVVSFRIEAGTVTQLTGASGVGKSTLAEALMRLHPVAPGMLSYGGAEACGVRIASVLERISMSPQMPAFLPGTVADQLRLAKPEASEAEMRAALETALADEFVFARAEGLESLIGEGGAGFSGGELRRLGLARALLAGPELLILDEPFAGLDKALADRLAARLSDWLAGGQRAILILQHKADGRGWPQKTAFSVVL
ncbi:ATP-binding cassette domain-containing protein [Hyphomonas sp. NPDC076900]|uniref:ATP-binding cassette domain-containing protein n=1 Tax=unclassified Hyphomonas TaxID=2630699 RepID=UPI003D085C8C